MQSASTTYTVETVAWERARREMETEKGWWLCGGVCWCWVCVCVCLVSVCWSHRTISIQLRDERCGVYICNCLVVMAFATSGHVMMSVSVLESATKIDSAFGFDVCDCMELCGRYESRSPTHSVCTVSNIFVAGVCLWQCHVIAAMAFQKRWAKRWNAVRERRHHMCEWRTQRKR